MIRRKGDDRQRTFDDLQAIGPELPPDVIARASSVIPIARDTPGVASTKTAPRAANRSAAAWEFWLAALVLGLAFASRACDARPVHGEPMQ